MLRKAGASRISGKGEKFREYMAKCAEREPGQGESVKYREREEGGCQKGLRRKPEVKERIGLKKTREPSRTSDYNTRGRKNKTKRRMGRIHGK